MNKAIFLDRDGTINVEKQYMYRIEDFEWIRNADKAIAKLKQLGYLVIVTSNQSGIGRGYYTKNDVEMLHNYMNNLLLQSTGTTIDAFYFCPHTDENYCNCRKPKLGMYLSAQREFDIDLRNSYLVGDRLTDIVASEKLNCNYGLVLTGYGMNQDSRRIDSSNIYQDLYEFANKLEKGK